MLLEMHVLFTLIDERMDFSPYKLLIFPDEIEFSAELAAKVERFIADGGKVILSGESGLNEARTGFAIDAGLELVGRSEWQPDFIVAGERLGLPVEGPFVAYSRAWDVKPVGAEALAGRRWPYFNRRYDHFCSPQHTPDAEDSPFPAATTNGSVHMISQCATPASSPTPIAYRA